MQTQFTLSITMSEWEIFTIILIHMKRRNDENYAMTNVFITLWWWYFDMLSFSLNWYGLIFLISSVSLHCRKLNRFWRVSYCDCCCGGCCFCWCLCGMAKFNIVCLHKKRERHTFSAMKILFLLSSTHGNV